MADTSAFEVSIIAVLSTALFFGIQSFVTEYLPMVNPILVSLVATFFTTFIMASLLRKKKKSR